MDELLSRQWAELFRQCQSLLNVIGLIYAGFIVLMLVLYCLQFVGDRKKEGERL